ncbi:OmpL47-type beta-barrel domain-containing protein [Paenibacillus hubeiensis]|uniref:OmpL47-type beta-barrel domain-containing protein n=1 Tax=Paenibacillus hubeiensis TaxID=3077330 RepID=UPI0031BA756C
MENQKKEKKKYSIRIGWKRSLIVTLVIALIAGGYSFTRFGPKAQAAEFVNLTKWNTYYSPAAKEVTITAELSDGTSVYIPPSYYVMGYFPPYSVSPVGAKKYRQYSGTYGGKYTPEGASYITDSGDLYMGDTVFASGVKDYVSVMDRHFILYTNGTVKAFGKGSSGELGVGSAQDRTAPTYVVDPITGEPLQGIKKIFIWNQNENTPGVLLVGDGKVYAIGYIFKQNSFTNAKPIDVTSSFPSFSSAEDFELKYLEGVDYTRDGVYLNSSTLTTVSQARRIFIINGSKYSLTNFFAADQTNIEEQNAATSLIKLPDSFNPENVKRLATTYKYLNTSTGAYTYYKDSRSTLYYSLDNGVLTYWGTPFNSYGKMPTTFDAKVQTASTGVSAVTGHNSGTLWFIKNKYLYALGSNQNDISGVAGGTLSTPTLITGPANEIDGNVVAFETSASGRWVLTENGELIGFQSGNQGWKKMDKKYLSIFSHSTSAYGEQKVFGITEDFELYNLTDISSPPNLVGPIPKIAPAEYVAPITAPNKPVISVTGQDKFNQNIVSVDFGTAGNIATKQYQINGGRWIDYTGDIVVTQSGSVTVQARSADHKGNISEVGELAFTSDPIVITSGHPTIDKVTADEFKISAEATGNIKVQVKVDGDSWQDFNVANHLLLTPGDHKIEVRLLNDRDQELINKTFNVTADNPAPVVVGKPIVTQKGLNNQYGLDIEISYDASQGEALYSIDGGEWITTTGSFSVSNAAHTIRAKVVTTDGKESEVTEFVTTPSQPKITVNADQVSIDLGINTSEVTVHYKDSNNQWVEYTGPVSYGPGTYNIEIEVRDRNTGTPVFTGGPYTVTVMDPNAGNPGNGGTTPTPDPGTGTPIGQEDVDFTVFSGGLSSRFEGADLSTIIIDNTNPYQSINSVSRALIEDSRGNGKGYQYSLDVTDFVSDPMQDNSTNSQSLVVSIPANSLSVDVLSTKTITGPAAELSNVGKHVFTGTGPEMLATAKAFEGMGYVEIPLNFTLSIPDRVKIISSGSGSKFVPGESTGLMAGIYKSKFTFTLSSGI